MMKENIKDLILAIAEGDSIAIEDNFNTVMASKIADRLDDLRVNVAGSMFGSTVVEESYELDDYSLEEIEEFMMSEEFEQLDELSKKTLGSYVKQAGDSVGALATTAMHQRHQSDEWSRIAGKKATEGDFGGSKEANKKSTEFGKYSFDSTERQLKRQKGIKKAVDKLTKEEVELDEAREEHDDANASRSSKGSAKGSSLHSMDIAKRSGYTHAVMHDGTKGGVDTYHTTKASAEKRLTALRNKHGIPEYSNRASIAEL